MGDAAGVSFRLTPSTKAPTGARTAGVVTLISVVTLPPRSVVNVDSACPVTEAGASLEPIAVQVHTHSRSSNVSLWRIDRRKSWQLIGSWDPRVRQLMPTQHLQSPGKRISQGDILAARCVMENPSDKWIGNG